MLRDLGEVTCDIPFSAGHLPTWTTTLLQLGHNLEALEANCLPTPLATMRQSMPTLAKVARALNTPRDNHWLRRQLAGLKPIEELAR